MAVVKRGKILRGDLALYDGRSATASRVDATGGTLTGLPVGHAVDILQVYGNAANRTNSTIAAAISQIGSANVTLVFSPGTWSITANTTIPSNFTCHVPAGCVFSVDSGITLTFSGPVIAEANATHASGSGTVVGLDNGGIGGAFYRRTDAEIAALVSPVNFQYPPGDVRRYGAVAGQVSTTAIQNAVDSCPEGFQVTIPDDYQTGEIALTNWTNRVLTGPGSLTLISSASDTAVILRLAGTANNILIENLLLVGTNDNTKHQTAITGGPAATLTNIKVSGCTFRDGNVGVYAAGYSAGGLYGGWVIDGCYFDNMVGTGTSQGIGVVVENPLGVIVSNNVFRRTQRHAVYHGLGSDSLGYLNVVNNLFELHRSGVAGGTQRPAVSLGRGANCKCTGNIFRECSDGAVDVFFDTSLTVNFRNAQITDNFFINRANAIPDVTIALAEDPGSYTVAGAQVDNNYFVSDQDTGGTAQFVYVYNGSRGSICGNTFIVNDAGSSQYIVRLGDASAINADADCTDWLIANNKCYVQGALAGSCKFLVVASDICTNTSKHIIRDNDVFGPGYLDYGTDPPTNANLKCDANGSYTGTLTGCATSPTATVEWSVSNRVVTLELPALTAVSNSTALKTITGMPVAIRPVSAQVDVGLVTDNGVTSWGRISIGTGGTITLQFNNLGVATNPGEAGAQACSLVYRLD